MEMNMKTDEEKVISDIELLTAVRQRCYADPAFQNNIILAAVDAVRTKAEDANSRAVDMEVVASVAMGFLGRDRITAKAKKYFADLVASKLARWEKKKELRTGLWKQWAGEDENTEGAG